MRLAGASLLCLCVLLTILSFTGAHVNGHFKALFLFGDSLIDSGNHNTVDPALVAPWHFPYGITWPGSPTGRYSDGYVLSDYYADYLDVPIPVPYRVIDSLSALSTYDAKALKPFAQKGINFAFGGSGVFPTFGPQFITVEQQIQQFKDLIASDVVQQHLIHSSIVLLVVARNDYAFIDQLNETDANALITKVVDQIGVSLQELKDLGFKTLLATNLEPWGCLPARTSLNNYTSCNIAKNAISDFHNTLLESTISALQNENPDARFSIFDINSGFQAVLEDKPPLRPCCDGVNGASCGDVDEDNNPLYTLCPDIGKAFYWDFYHPTHDGWEAILEALLPDFKTSRLKTSLHVQ